MKGKVYLVGAGPGNAGLITVRAVELLKTCDVIVYDYLANKRFLDYARTDAEIIYVGKKGGAHTVPQGGINDLLIQKANEGKSVLRLKGGDPYIFGRGGEEAEELVDAGLEFEVVPGVTAAIGASAYAGIPLTHRKYSSTVAFVTGHEDPDKDETAIDWEKISTGIDSLVFFMGVKNLPYIVDNLLKHGRNPDTPVALVRWGTTPDQQTWVGTLGTIKEIARREGVAPPSLIIVGDEVKLREKLNWFEKKPLFGRRIIVTRARAQASDFVIKLEAAGAEAVEFPTIETVDPESWEDLDAALERVGEYDWMIFTSVNGVKYLLKRLKETGRDIRDLAGPKICAIGKITAKTVEDAAMRVDLVPDEYRAEAVIEAIGDVKGKKIFIPRAKEARELLPEELRKKGARVDVAAVYRTVKPDAKKNEILQMIREGKIDMVTFTSSSTVTNFAEMFDDGELKEVRGKLKVASIGPITSETAEKLGFNIDVTPDEYTIEALTRSVIDCYSKNKG
ncbi:MAG: uroporphyrinogen-III C-methyltransferase [Nitrospinota bacterium]